MVEGASLQAFKTHCTL